MRYRIDFSKMLFHEYIFIKNVKYIWRSTRNEYESCKNVDVSLFFKLSKKFNSVQYEMKQREQPDISTKTEDTSARRSSAQLKLYFYFSYFFKLLLERSKIFSFPFWTTIIVEGDHCNAATSSEIKLVITWKINAALV